MDSTADQSFDISLLDSLPPTGAGPIDPGLPDSIFTLDLYGAFDSGITAVEPFSTAATGTFLSATSTLQSGIEQIGPVMTTCPEDRIFIRNRGTCNRSRVVL